MTNEELLRKDWYQIVATDRSTGKRYPITGHLRKEVAESYKHSASIRKLYKYFRVVKVKDA